MVTRRRQNVAQVSTDPLIRSVVNNSIRTITKELDVITEGRDMTTVVFPKAEVKIYVDARAEIRAQRRFEQNPGGRSYEQILQEIQQRDKIDQSKKVGALKISSEATYLDTSDLTIDRVCEKVVEIIKNTRNRNN